MSKSAKSKVIYREVAHAADYRIETLLLRVSRPEARGNWPLYVWDQLVENQFTERIVTQARRLVSAVSDAEAMREAMAAHEQAVSLWGQPTQQEQAAVRVLTAEGA